MNWRNISKTLAPLALSLTIFVSGCGRSTDGRIVVELPPLDPRDEKPCYDPGIAEDAFDALGEHRVALADCRRRHQNAIDQYNEARTQIGTGKGPQ